MFEFTVEVILSLVIAICLSILLFNSIFGTKSNIPGPYGLPVIGHLHLIGSRPLHQVLCDLSRQYGDIFSLRLGQREAVVLSSKEILKEALVEKGKIFASRPDLPLFRYTRNGRIGFTLYPYGEEYVHNRKLAVYSIHQHLKSHGDINTIFNVEMKKMKSLFDSYAKEKRSVNPSKIFEIVIPSLFFPLMFGVHFDYNDEEIQNFVKDLVRWFKISESDNPSDFIPILEYLPNTRIKALKELSSSFEKFSLKSMRLISSYKGSIYNWLNDSPSQYSALFRNNEEEEKARLLTEILGGGFETVNTTLTWALLFFHERPDVVINCRKELEEVGQNFTVREYQLNTPYFFSVACEILRFSSVTPLGIVREITEDVYLREFFIRKGTLALTNLWSVNHSSDIWKFPNEFNPNNFYISDSNSVDTTSLKQLMAFSDGVRKCPGYELAKKMLLEILKVIFLNYEVTISKTPADLEPMKGLTIKPKYYEIQFEKI